MAQHKAPSAMDYPETIAWLDTVIRTGIKYDLQNIRRLLALLGNPERSFPTVCICGTNGKGSTGAFLESILTEAGYRVGLNTSPHLASPRERLRINRQITARVDFAATLSRVREASLRGWSEDDPSRPTFFETMTSAALLYFQQQSLDIALMEAGLGGRLDASNALQPVMTLITRIGMDHPKTLGNTLKKIAFEKFGLARAGRPLIIARQRPHVAGFLEKLARYRGAHARRAGGVWTTKNGSLHLQTRSDAYSGITLSLPGRYQRENAATAVCAAELLRKRGFFIHRDHIITGLAKAYWPGRLELREGKPRLLMDGSHNTDGIGALVRELKKIPAGRRILIYGKVGERSPRQTAAKLLPLADTVLLPPIPVGRANPPEELLSAIADLHDDIQVCESIDAAWQQARELYSPDDLIIVAGSLYLVGHFKKAIEDFMDADRA